MRAPEPKNEADRLIALHDLGTLDSAPEPAFDALVRAASLVCGVPIALISLVDAKRQWFKANIGLPGVTETSRDAAFCAHTILQDDILEVPDAMADPRFADNELVISAPDIRFYAGAPIRLPDGNVVGTLAVIDRVVRRLDDFQREILRCLALSASAALEGWRLKAEAEQALRSLRAGEGARREAEAHLAEERQRLANIIATTGVGTWQWHVPTGAMRFSDRWAEMLGYSPEELVGATNDEVRHAVHPDDMVQRDRDIAEHFAGRLDSFSQDIRARRRDGQWIVVHSRGSLIARTADGAPEWVFGIWQDVTERERQEAALRASEEFLEYTGRLAHVGGWVAYPATGALSYTDETYRLFGLDVGTPVNIDRVIDFYEPQARPILRVAIERAMTLGEVWDLTLPAVRADGQRIWLRTIGNVVYADGKPSHLKGAAQDVTAMVERRLALEQANERIALATDYGGIGIWDWDVLNGPSIWQPQMYRLYGLPVSVAPVSFDLWLSRIHPDDRAPTLRAVNEALEGTRDYDHEFRVIDDSGSVRHLRTAGRVARDESGRAVRMLGANWDVTEPRKLAISLAEQHDILRHTGQLAKVGGWQANPATGAVTYTDEAYRIHGLATGMPVNLDMAIGFYEPEARSVIRATIARAMKDGVGWDWTLPMIRVDGVRIWVRTLATVTFVDGKPSLLSGAAQDVTAMVEKQLALEEANDRLALATESGGIGLWDADIAAGHAFYSPTMFRLYGLPNSDHPVKLEEWLASIHPEDRPFVRQAMQDGIDGVTDFQSEFRVERPNGEICYLRSAGRVKRDPAGRVVRMVGANWDVTEPRKLAMRLSEQHELLRVTLRSIGDGVITTDPGGAVHWLNPVAERLTGWRTDDAAGRPLSEVFRILNEDTRNPVDSPVEICLREGRIVGLANHTLLISREGGEYGIEDSAAPIRNDDGDILGVVLVFHDVSEQRRLTGEMSHRASHDTLTGLVNRPEFETRLRWLLHMAHSDKSENAVLYIDLDEFKIINDTCGHAAGDQVLRQVAKLLGDVVRASDTLARLGGDEFAIILHHCSTSQATTLAQRICDNMENFRFMHQERRFRIGASIGLVPVDDRWASTEAIMQAADSSCYAAKEAGRNRVHCWFDSDTTMHARRGEMRWTARLEQALEENRFVLFAQRIEPLDHDHQGIHAEILLRLRETDGALIAPGAFLPAAERYHLAPRIDRWVLQRALAWMQQLPPIKPGVLDTICVNLSGQSVGDATFHNWARDMLVEAGAPTRARLCLEITETVAITNLADAARFVAQVRELGVRVALDDFGAGAASFGYLKNLAVDFLKIDGQFIRDLVTDRLDEAAVRCFADVARVAGLRTVAECVDHPDILERLRAMGIDFAQGFLMHRPSPIDDLMINDRHPESFKNSAAQPDKSTRPALPPG